MNCPECDNPESSVTKTMKGHDVIRTRVCSCGVQWGTRETVVESSIKRVAGVVRQPIPIEIIRFVLDRDGNRCRYCGTPDDRLGIDHVIPLCAPIPTGVTREDETLRRNAPENLVACCKACNESKGDKVDGKRQSQRYTATPNSPTRPLADTRRAKFGPLSPNGGGGVGGDLSGDRSGDRSGSGSQSVIDPDPISRSEASGVPIGRDRPPRPPRRPVMAAATIPFLEVFDRYPRKYGKARAAQVWQELAETHPGGEVALSREILAVFDRGLLGHPPYVGEEQHRPMLETFLADRGWEDPIGRAPTNGTHTRRPIREIPD